MPVVPSRRVSRWSRTYPRIRLTTVMMLIMEADLRICRLWVTVSVKRVEAPSLSPESV